MRYWLVMPAAGVGRRFGSQQPKQYADLHGRTVIEWALAPFLEDSRCYGAVVAIAAGDPYWPGIAARLPRVIVAAGGAERSQSVRNGLSALANRGASVPQTSKDSATADDWVLVHDAARPCLSRQDLDRLLEGVGSHTVGGLLATPAADTLKRAGGDGAVEETVDRKGMWRALTPQMFRYGRLCDALDRALAAGRLPTDEAQALEWAGARPLVIEGSAANIKITSADDLVVAAALLSVRANVGGRQA